METLTKIKSNKRSDQYKVTRNACKLCTPLGACLAFRGIEGAIPFLHGSQGCATYIRRYMISHFREPMDIASSSFTESSAIFGGRENLQKGIRNVIKQYNPQLIGIASTCLSETIGDDIRLYLKELEAEAALNSTHLVNVSTPSYSGTHADGFFNTIRETVHKLAEGGPQQKAINLIPNMVSPADIRYFKEILSDFGIDYVLFPDYSDTLDGTTWNEYQKIPEGGTSIESIQKMGQASATVEFLSTFDETMSAGATLKKVFDIPNFQMMLPIGIHQTDQFFNLVKFYSENPISEKHTMERGRLIDSYVDAHKYIFGKKAILYGEQDLVIAMAAFLSEVGMIPVVCASGARTGKFEAEIKSKIVQYEDQVKVIEAADFVDIEKYAMETGADILIGSSKAQRIARNLDIPLVRIGFPIHDRFGGARLMHVGYRGTQQLFDRIVNAIIQQKQKKSPVGYAYM